MISSVIVLSVLASMIIGSEGATTGVSVDMLREPRIAQYDDDAIAADSVAIEPLREEGERERPEGLVAGAVADEVLQTWNFGGRSNPGYVSNRPSYHPGTRVIVDVVLRGASRFRAQKGGTNVGVRVLAGLRNRGYWPFRNCFEQAAREQPDPGGKTELIATLAAQGNVVGVRLLRTHLKNRAIAQCIGRELRALRLDKPIGHRVDALITVSLWPGDLPLLPSPRQAKPELRQPAKYVDWDRPLASLLSVFRECLVPARQRDPKLWGRLSIAFSVDGEGRASDFAESLSQFGDERAKNCVVSVLAELSWPRPRSGSRLEFALRLSKPTPLATTPPEGDEPPANIAPNHVDISQP
ncbi:MAG: hypothetical protein QM784_32715 [Polyangiaceae bacterium]